MAVIIPPMEDLILVVEDEPSLRATLAHNLERMANRVTNICEHTIYITTGELMEIDASDDELRVLNL